MQIISRISAEASQNKPNCQGQPNLATPIIPGIARKTRARTCKKARTLVAPPMLCHNQAGTGTAARAVGVGTG